MRAIVVTDRAAGTAGMKMVERLEPQGASLASLSGAKPAIHHRLMDGVGFMSRAIPFSTRGKPTFPLEAPRRLWEFTLCPSSVKGVTQVIRKLALMMFSVTSAGVYAGLPSPVFAFANDTRGAAVFKGHCTPCHGKDGKGEASVGTPDFTSPKIQASLTDSEITDIITNGKKGTIMPAWKGNLSPQEISAAASYVRSLGGGH